MNKNSYKIIHLLSSNSRLSSKEVAKNVKTTQQNASYSINKLESENKILNFKLLIDSSKFGYGNFCVFLRLRYYSKNKLNDFLEQIKKYKEIVGIEFLFGSFDIFLRFSTPNASNFNKIFKEILNKNPSMILNHLILTQIVLYNYPLNYLSKKKFQERVIISGDREIVEVDTLDKKIINLLNQNSRKTSTEIADKTRSTPKTIIQRIKNLERKQIIKGYSVIPNHKKLKIQRNYILIKLNYHDPEVENQFNRFCDKQINIVESIKVFGVWDQIIIVECLENDEFKRVIYSMKENFPEFVVNYTFYESEEVKMWKYVPELE